MDAPFDILGLAMDAIGASLPQFVVPVAFYGMRPEERKLAITVKCLVVEGTFTAPGDTPAPILERDFNVTFPGVKWVVNTQPNVGDWVRFPWANAWLWGKVAHVGRMPSGDYQLSVVHNPKEKGYPTW